MNEQTLSISIELTIHPLEVVLRTCHAFAAHCHVFVHGARDGIVIVDLTPKDDTSPRDLTGKFGNALIDMQLRALIANETRAIRELLIAQAFCEADLLDRRDVESDERVDPKRIAR